MSRCLYGVDLGRLFTRHSPIPRSRLGYSVSMGSTETFVGRHEAWAETDDF
ncbi:hypothetical protein SAMN05660489_04261 [Pseudomonas sp. LAMO17WK12:I10]|nr:hypothetical protein H160_04490 [Pseudomonas sp. LAMO17WK12:I9]SNY44894.1 hypothetical protein SAMN05660489_04261 [Pseudomonas sp. LAMO17WK12:I10]